jgi:hypothetical protein
MTKNEKEVLERGRLIENLIASEGWRYAEDKLKNLILGIDSIKGLPDTINMFEVIGRKYAIQIIEGWIAGLKGEIELANQIKAIASREMERMDIYIER